MDKGVRRESNTLELIAVIQELPGNTPAERNAACIRAIDTMLSEAESGSRYWRRLLGIRGLVQGFARLDLESDEPKEEPSSHALAA